MCVDRGEWVGRRVGECTCVCPCVIFVGEVYVRSCGCVWAVDVERWGSFYLPPAASR